ncbi:CBO0543 family protein [Brevibacillus migulae]|uniref:CBO0543 family protein n=1 Tax=Brevibacillus migulae TaxID=1644114 RepID=UPI00106E1EA2|nr:CBO0543 family protein [Brevibacillus migulae]
MLLLLISIVVLNAIAFLIPKKLTRLEIYVTSLFAVYFAVQVDVYLNLRHDMYGYFSTGANYRSLLVIWGLYPAFSIIFLNLYPYQSRVSRKIAYLLWMTLLSTALEWLFSRGFGFFYHGSWKLIYSFFTYPFLLVALLLHLHLIRKFLIRRQ